MTHSNSSTPWTTHDALHLYGLDRWGRGFFSVSPAGNVTVTTAGLSGEAVRYDLHGLVQSVCERGGHPPMIVRFPGIIRQRLQQINQVFDNAINEFDFRGRYRCIYPIKVNQHAEVVGAVLDLHDQVGVGLESGSKAELLTVIARARPGTKLLCNGFKDRQMVEMAFLARAVGHDVTIVIEKPSDIDLVLQVARELKPVPRLGIRTKLGWKGAGHWSSTNGIKSKFGLNATELLEGIQSLRASGLLPHLRLLHFHPGSQINDVRLIKSALIEVTRVYADLVGQGVPLDTIDVGGGLAIDYTGGQNRDPSSMNYTLQEYANDVVYYIQMVCNQAGIPHPDIFSESGRAVVAHHSVLIVPVFATSERPLSFNQTLETGEFDPEELNLQPLSQLQDIARDIDHQLGSKPNNLDERVLAEAYHDAQQSLEMALQLFVNGHLSLKQRSVAERLYWRICDKIRSVFNLLEFVPEDLRELRDHLADTYFANFSLFQSLPDSWALDQLFPIIPIHRLSERPDRRGVIGDITCDSDGQINSFLSNRADRQQGDPLRTDRSQSLPLHAVRPGEPYWLGIFLVGAYQEALSDDHNLLGKFNTLIVDTAVDGTEIRNWLPGSDLREVIQHVNHDWDRLLSEFAASCRMKQPEFDLPQLEEPTTRNTMSAVELEKIVDYFKKLSGQYTYLADANQRFWDPEWIESECESVSQSAESRLV